jgi:release factor glutamine methyltransferase
MREYAYRDKKLGDTQTIAVATAPDVFHPTSTTVLLLRAARRALGQRPRRALDLGCGCGIVAIVLAKCLPAEASVCASDLSAGAIRLARHNAARQNVSVDCRRGSLFEPWNGDRFDLIVDDVAGVAEPIARLSGWYPPQVPSEAGRDGTRWLSQILAEAPDHLTPGGSLLFPLLTLSRESTILDQARSIFATVDLVEEQWYPLGEELLAHVPLIEELAAEGNVHLERRGSRLCWATRIYSASGRART